MMVAQHLITYTFVQQFVLIAIAACVGALYYRLLEVVGEKLTDLWRDRPARRERKRFPLKTYTMPPPPPAGPDTLTRKPPPLPQLKSHLTPDPDSGPRHRR
jgi:hypothetical protein